MDKTAWYDGFPEVDGEYRCLLEGEFEITLNRCTCPITQKPRWVDKYGADVIERVQWTES